LDCDDSVPAAPPGNSVDMPGDLHTDRTQFFLEKPGDLAGAHLMDLDSRLLVRELDEPPRSC
jgi:hypothetical protein